jgi:hypothetical protein
MVGVFVGVKVWVRVGVLVMVGVLVTVGVLVLVLVGVAVGQVLKGTKGEAIEQETAAGLSVNCIASLELEVESGEL